MMDIKRKVLDTIKTHNLIEDGAHIVIGLSGGPDSVCLFDVLCELAGEHDWKLHPVHINHKFRPGAAEEDAEYVRGLAASRGWPAAIYEVDCTEMAAREGLTAEEAGRKARYEAFAGQARAIRENVSGGENAGFECASCDNQNVKFEYMGSGQHVHSFSLVPREAVTEPAGKAEDCSGSVIVSTPHQAEGKIVGGVRCDVHENVVIAVAQNANDQAETILFRILRGTGIDGLSGIAYKRYEGDIPVVRPLLDVPRKDIEEYLAARGIEPRIDHTNSEVTYTRNRIRLELIPYLAEHFNENIIETVNRLGKNAACDRDFIGQEAERALASVWAGDMQDAGAAPAACGSGAGSQTQLEGLPAAGWHGQVDRPASAARAAVDSVPARQKGTESSSSAAARQVEILVAPTRTLHRAVRTRIYTMLLKRVGLEENITAAALSQIDDVLFAASPSAMTEIAGGYVVARVYDKLRFYKADGGTKSKMSKKGSAPDKPACQVSADESGFTVATPTFTAHFALTEEQAAHVEIRKRQAGDHIALKIGGQIRNKKLSDFFVDEKVPKLARDDIDVLALGSDILWIMPSEHFASKPLRSKGRFSAKYKA